MNAKVISLAVAGLLGLAASADVLYWQVNNAAADADGATKAPYEFAILGAKDASGNQYYVSQNIDMAGDDAGPAVSREYFSQGGYVGGVMDAAKILSMDENQTAYTGSLSALSFFVELYGSTGNWVGESTTKTYDELVNSGAISGFNATFQGVNQALGSTGAYSPVPEPTSGLLMLVGLGALALRRRKVA